MREWLSGGAPPCQGGGRGFDPRLALEKRTIPNRYRSFFRALVWVRKFDVYAPLRSAQAEVHRTSCAVSRFLPLDFFKKFLFHVTSDKFLLLHSLPLNYLLNQMLYNQIIM